MGMLGRRWRATPEIDPAFALKPLDTADPVFLQHDGFVDSDVVNDSRLPAEDVAAELKGDELKEALKAANLSTGGTVAEKRERYAEWLAAQEAIDPEDADITRDPAEPEGDSLADDDDLIGG